MALVNRSFNLDITPGAIPQVVKVSEYDQNRQYTVTLIDEGGEYEIPSGTTATIEGTIGDSGFSETAAISGNTIMFNLTESMTAKAGDVWCKIKLTKDSKPIQTCGFILRCDKAGLESGTVTEAGGFDTLVKNAVLDVVPEVIEDYIPESVVEDATEQWLNNHPEATTTVQDGSITEEKLADSLKLKTVKDYVTPQMYGAKGDGVTDDTESFQALAAYCNSHPGSIVYLPKGRYILSERIAFSSDIEFYGDGENTVLDFTSIQTGADPMLSFSGSFGQLGQTSADADIGDLTLETSIASQLESGDIITIENPADYSWSKDRDYFRAGEMCKVKSVSGTTATLESALLGSYVSGCNIGRVNPISVHLHGFAVEVYDMGATASFRGVEVSFASPVRIENLTGSGSNSAQLGIKVCNDAVVDGCTYTYISRELAGTNYGIVIVNSQNVTVRDCTLTAMRHGIAIGGVGNLYYGIVNRFIRIENCCITAGGGTMYAADCHPNAQYVTYSGCTILGGIDLCGADVTITGCKVTSLPSTGQCIVADHMVGCNVTITDNDVISLPFTTANASAAVYCLFRAAENTDDSGHVVVSGNRIRHGNSLKAIYLNAAAVKTACNATVMDNVVDGDDAFFDADGAGSIMVSNFVRAVVSGNVTKGRIRIEDGSTAAVAVLVNAIVQNNVVQNAKTEGISIGGLLARRATVTATVTGNTVSGCSKSGVYLENLSDAIVTGNRMTDNGDVTSESANERANMYFTTVSGATVCDNIFGYRGKSDPSNRLYNVNGVVTIAAISNNRVLNGDTHRLDFGRRAATVYHDSQASNNPIYVMHNTSYPTGTAPYDFAYGTVGSIVFNSAPASGEPVGWICTVAADMSTDPKFYGTWVPFGTLA